MGVGTATKKKRKRPAHLDKRTQLAKDMDLLRDSGYWQSFEVVRDNILDQTDCGHEEARDRALK